MWGLCYYWGNYRNWSFSQGKLKEREGMKCLIIDYKAGISLRISVPEGVRHFAEVHRRYPDELTQ